MNRGTTDKGLVYARNTESAFFLFRKPTSIRYVTGTPYSDNIPEVQVCRSSVVSRQIGDTSRHVRVSHLLMSSCSFTFYQIF